MSRPIFFDNSIVHFRTLNPLPDGITPSTAVAHSELKRAMFKTGFAGIGLTGTITPDVDYGGTDGTSTWNTAITGDTVVENDFNRIGPKRTMALIGKPKPPLTTGFSYAPQSFPFSIGLPDPSTSSRHYTRTYIDNPPPDEDETTDETLGIWTIIVAPAFMRVGSDVALVFAAYFSTNSYSLTHSAMMAIYAPVDGATPEEFYGIPTQSEDGDGEISTEIAEDDAGTILGVPIKCKGWSYEVIHDTPYEEGGGTSDTGTEIYTPSVTIAEL